MTTIVLASHNEKKAREMRALLPTGIDVVTAGQVHLQMPEETGSTFEENALIKARAAARQSGHISVADDSGLEVDALNGMPGVRSARFAADHGRSENDEENNKLTLEKLESVPAADRTARFVSAVAVVSPVGNEIVVRGTVEGTLGFEPRGTNGFGYDPLFFPAGFTETMAVLSAEQKNAISHRARAFESALPYIVSFVESSEPVDD